MKTKIFSVVAALLLASIAGCSTAPAKYTYVVDPDLTEQANSLTRTSSHTGHVVWVNPPMKRVPVNQQP
uniref:Lipoprotein n=1 Tax=Rheinheimera sp. BAL341 TaxID=1708203 RepID=A0A486XT53_9GAMM